MIGLKKKKKTNVEKRETHVDNHRFGEIIQSSWWTTSFVHHFSKRLLLI